MEKPNAKGANNFVVGLFVFVALVVSAGFVVFMGGSVSWGSEVSVTTVFRDVRGLIVGAPVYFSGIKVGRVVGLEFPKAGADQDRSLSATDIVVSLSIYGEFADRIKVDSLASIGSQGVLGDKVLMLGSGSPEAANIQSGNRLPSMLPKDFSEYISSGGDLVKDLHSTILEVKALLVGVNKSGHLPTTLRNMEELSGSLSQTSKAIEKRKENLGKSLDHLSSILAKLDNGEGTLGALINDPSLHEDLRVLLGGAKRSTAVRLLLKQAIKSHEDKTEKNP